jgi:thiosulfate dehydrogenase [quinone] large subunit
MKQRYWVIAVVAFLGFWLLRMGTGSDWSGGMQALALLAGAVLFVGSAWWLMRGYQRGQDEVVLQNPTLSHFLFDSTRSAPLWLGARVFLGYEWFQAGWHKVVDPEWMSGAGILSYWQRAASIPEQGRAPITYDWYRDFIQGLINGGHQTWFGPFVAYGEVLVGVGLIVGALVGVAAFFGALMNMSFMLAGSASTNPVLFSLAILMILAWKVAGYIGIDRWLLPVLGAPWNPGTVFQRRTPQPQV